MKQPISKPSVALMLGFFLLLPACSGALGTAAGFLTGGGPNVAANVQAGATNSQTVGSTENRDASIRTEGDVRQDNSQLIVNEASPWLLLLALSGWLVAAIGWADNIATRIWGLKR